jgi:hypothetical protein
VILLYPIPETDPAHAKKSRIPSIDVLSELTDLEISIDTFLDGYIDPKIFNSSQTE